MGEVVVFPRTHYISIASMPLGESLRHPLILIA